MARFQAAAAFADAGTELQLLPLRFERLGASRFLVANLVGDLLLLNGEELDRVVSLAIAPGDGYERAFEKLLVSGKGQRSQLQLLALRLRSRMAFLREPTPLHLFVVTLRCEHSCPYCQVSRRRVDRDRFDMSEETARRAVNVALSAPAPRIKVEFQGGEPLLNFELVRKIVGAVQERAPVRNKTVEFVIASNLALLTDEMLASLDGPANLHNRNRPRPGGNSHELAVAGIRRAQAVLGRSRVSALMKTTEASLARVEEIVDEYLRLDLDGIFLRSLSPFGNTLAQCAPQCSSCAYEPHCGAEPVYHHATQGDALGIKPLSEFCARQKGVLQLLFEVLQGGGQEAAVLRRWAGR